MKMKTMAVFGMSVLFGAALCGSIFAMPDMPVRAEVSNPPPTQTEESDPPSEPVTQVTVTFDTQGGNAIDAATVNYGETAAVPDTPTKADATGDAETTKFTFAGWYDGTEEGAAEFDFAAAVTEDTTVYAKWTETTITTENPNPEMPETVFYVTFEVEGKTHSVFRTDGGKITAALLTKEHYTFDGWYDGETKVEAGAEVTATENKKLTGSWKGEDITITFSVDGTETPVTVEYGKPIAENKIPAEPVKQPTTAGLIKTTYTFAGWYAGTQDDAEKFDFTASVTEAATVYAKWTEIKSEEFETTPHAVAECNKNLSEAATDYSKPVKIPYDGTYTGRYAIQAYAGLSGEAWIIGGTSTFCDYGTGSHPFGSNNGDNRRNFAVTMAIDAQAAGEAYLYIYAETLLNEAFTLKVNDGAATSVTLAEGYVAQWDKAYPVRPCILPVTLAEGLNSVMLTAGENYTFWMHSFSVAPTAVRMHTSNENENLEFHITSWKQTGGDMSADTLSIGLNAFDDAANYGKEGFAEYEIYAAEAGDYTLGMYVMAGNALANRATLTLNGSVVTVEGKNYVSFNTAAGWGGDSWNYVDLALTQGVNTLRIANCLTTVNAGKTEEVADGTAGSVKVSNWWMHNLSLQKKSAYALVSDTQNLTCNFGLQPTPAEIKEKIAVYLSVDGQTQETPLDKTLYDITVNGNTVTVSYTGSEYETVQSTTLSLIETTEGVAQAGKTVNFDGTQSTGKLPWYGNAAVKGEGTGVCAGRLFWVMRDQYLSGGGYIFGSNGAGNSENRQMTLTLTVNNTGEAGAYLLKSYANANNYEKNGVQIKVNDGDYVSVNMNGPKQGNVQLPFVYALTLAAGENTIELKLCEQYSAWFEHFEITPVSYEDKEEYKIEDASREGAGCFDTAEGLFVANAFDRALTYYVNVDKTGKYVLSFHVGGTAGKTLYVSVDGGAETALNTTGAADVSHSVDLTQGNHTVKVSFKGESGNVAFSSMKKEYIRPVTAIRLDTSEMTTTIENGENLNFAKLKVYVTYEGDDTETLIESGYTVDSSAVNNRVAGDYTVTVLHTAYPDVKATFTLTVKAAKAVSTLEVDASQIATLANGGTLDYSKLTVTLVYNDGTKIRAMSGDYIVTEPEGFSNTKAGEYTFTVRYASNDSISATFIVTVQAGEKKGGCGSVISGSIAGIGAMLAAVGSAAIVIKKKRK